MLDSTTNPIQQAYEEIRAYFAKPGAVLAKTMKEYGLVCLYRTPTGVGCAIGCRLSDAWIEAHGGAKAVNESGNINGLAKTFPDVTRIIGVSESQMWRFHVRAQLAHDDPNIQNASSFVRNLDRIAKNEFSLTVPS